MFQHPKIEDCPTMLKLLRMAEELKFEIEERKHRRRTSTRLRNPKMPVEGQICYKTAKRKMCEAPGCKNEYDAYGLWAKYCSKSCKRRVRHLRQKAKNADKPKMKGKCELWIKAKENL